MIRSAIAATLVLAACSKPQVAKPAPIREPGRYVDINGVKMYVEVHGSGPPLLLLHAGTATLELWPEASEHFAKHFRVIAAERMGHGRTGDNLDRTFTYHAMAEDMAALLAALKIDQAFVLGWSDGAIIGLDLAVNHPALVKRLAAAEAVAWLDGYNPEMLAWIRHVKPECAAGEKDGEDCWPAELSGPNKRLSPQGPAQWAVTFERMRSTMWLVDTYVSREQLARIASPVLLIAGDHGEATLAHTAQIFEAIPHAQLWIAPHADAFLPKTRAAVFNAAVEQFFVEK